MADERIICCCGASLWTKIIAWFQIIGNAILLILTIAGIATIEDQNEDDKKTYSVLVITLTLLGLIMGIILLIGAIQKRVGYLRAWLIYGFLACFSSVGNIVLNISQTSDNTTLGSNIVGGLIGIGFNFFSFAVVYIHTKEINELVLIS